MAVPTGDSRRFLAASRAGLHNLYGPTEAAIDVTSWECRDEPGRTTVPIGRPVANTRIDLLDPRLAPVPAGVLGELCIGGVQLARGYVGQPALTAERFVPDPAGDGARLYRTGDLARRRPDGAIEYAGRTDHQVKIRGFRIEPGEIEARLAEHPAVAEALVVAREAPAGRQLVAYIVGDAPAEALKEHLRRTLPDYMVPAWFVALDRLPLSANGKLDRKALPDPEWPESGLIEPATAAERLLCGVWQELLGLPQVGVGDNFFALGGDSILAIQLVGRARALGLRLSPRDVFRHQTVRELAAAAQSDAGRDERRLEATGEAALLPAQHWFFAQPMPHRAHWNQAVLLRPREPVDRTALAQAVDALLAHHEALRLRFGRDGTGAWRQHFVPTEQLAGPHLVESRAGADGLDPIVAGAHRSLDLEAGRLLRAELVDLPDGSQRLLLVIHHLAVDGVSWRILLEDLADAYRQAREGGAPSLPERTSSVQQWATVLTERAQDGAALAWWEAELAREVAALPADREGPPSLNGDAATYSSQLDRAWTARLIAAPNAYRMRMDELLLAALARTLCGWAGGDSVLVQLEGHGREELAPGIDLSRTVGWLTSFYPVRLTAPPGLGSDALLKTVKERLRAVPDHGLGFGLLRHLAPAAVQERMQALPTPEITFNYLGRFDASFGDGVPFVAAEESAGEGLAADSPMISPLTLDAQIHDGVLSMDWRHGARFEASTVRGLAAAFEANLRELIAHCAAATGITPSDFPLVELTQAQLDGLPIPPDRIEEVLPLAPMQEGLLMHTLLEPGSGIYLMQEHYFLDHALDPETFLRAWKLVLDRNAAMRATFHWSTGGQVVQAIVREPDIAMELLDWSKDAEAVRHERLESMLAAELGQGLELRRSPPIRIRLLRLAAERFCLVLSYHHILMDAWSRSHLLDDLLAVYRSLLAGEAPAPRDAVPFRAFVAWLRDQDEAATRAFWATTLEGFAEPTPLPAIRPAPRPVEGLVVGDVMTFLGEDETGLLRRLAHERQVTVNSFVQAAWALMLHLYSGRDDVLFGVTVAGRPADRPEFERTVGLFISSIPLRVRLPDPAAGTTVAAWLAEAWVERRGFPGVVPGLTLLRELCARYWDGLHPALEPDDAVARTAPFRWLSERLSVVLRELPVTAGPEERPYSTADRDRAQRLDAIRARDPKAVERAEAAGAVSLASFEAQLAATPDAPLRATHDAVAAAMAELTALEGLLDRSLGQDAPGFGALRQALADVAGLVGTALRDRPGRLVGAARRLVGAPPPTKPASAKPAAQAAIEIPAIDSREEAFRRLAEVVDFLARHEPHSLVVPLLERALEWGAMPLDQLLHSLTGGRRSPAALFELLGLDAEEPPRPVDTASEEIALNYQLMDDTTS